MFCGKCGNEIPNDAQFCPECGFRNVNYREGSSEMNADSSMKSNHKSGKSLLFTFFCYAIAFLFVYSVPKVFSYFFTPYNLEKSFINALDDMDIDYEIVDKDYDSSDKEMTIIFATDNAKYKAKVEPLGSSRIEYSIKQVKTYNEIKAFQEWKDMKEEMDD